MEPKDVLHATPYELWKRAEAWEKNARDAQGEVAQLTRQFAEAKAELRSHKAAMAGMQDELFKVKAERDGATTLTKREYVAAMMMQERMATGGYSNLEYAAGDAVHFADAILAELENKQ